MNKVDLNVDIGEGFPFDEALLEFATSANICCGEHSGSWELTEATIQLCRARGVRIGAHPGYPDRDGMGRRTLLPYNAELWNSSVVDQVRRFVKTAEPSYLKPHGAFYNDTAFPSEYIKAPPPGKVSEGSSYNVAEESGLDYQGKVVIGLPGGPALLLSLTVIPCLLGLPGTLHEAAAFRASASFLREGFADRKYTEFGTLVPRSEPGAVLEDPAQIKRQVLELAPKVDSICLHGDTPNCLEFAELVHKTLVDKGYEVGF